MEHLLTTAGYAALILFGFLEAACIPISSEITFGFAGVLAYEGHLNLALVIIIGSLAELAGSYASYAVGRAGGKPLVTKLGRYVLVTTSDVDRAERFLAGRGAWAVPVGRMVPFVRAFTSIVAGLVRIPPIRFGVLSLIGTVIYAAVLSSIGSAWPATRSSPCWSSPSWASCCTGCASSGGRAATGRTGPSRRSPTTPRSAS
jgi:membrane protein DedA with SNARE-associated domain